MSHDWCAAAWCVEHGIGRRVAGGTWKVSKVALAMLLDGDLEALAAYRDDGVRGSWEPVAKFYRRCGLGELLERREPRQALSITNALTKNAWKTKSSTHHNILIELDL